MALTLDKEQETKPLVPPTPSIREINTKYSVLDFPGMGGVSLIHSAANCKLTTLENISHFIIKKEYWDEILKKCRQVVYLNTYVKNVVNFIKENYELYGECVVPTGYGGNPNLHHIFIKNNLTTHDKSFLRAPVKGEEVLIKEEKIIIKDHAKILEDLLKDFPRLLPSTKRRIVNTFKQNSEINDTPNKP